MDAGGAISRFAKVGYEAWVILRGGGGGDIHRLRAAKLLCSEMLKKRFVAISKTHENSQMNVRCDNEDNLSRLKFTNCTEQRCG